MSIVPRSAGLSVRHPTPGLRRRRDGSERPPWAVAALTIVVAYLALGALLIGVGFLITHDLGPVRHWDDHVNSWFAAHRTSGWDSISRGGTFVANTMGVVVVAAVASGVALVRRWGRIALLLGCGLALEIALFLTVNYTVARPRPSAPHLGSTPSTYSFPSGHVAATLVLYGGVAVLVSTRTRAAWARVPAWAIAAVFVVWVAFSRVYEAQHHPSDVIAGLCLGIGALAATVLALRPSWPLPAHRPKAGTVDRDAVVARAAPPVPPPVHGDGAPAYQKVVP